MTDISEDVWLHITSSLINSVYQSEGLYEVLFCITNLTGNERFPFVYIFPGNSIMTTVACLQECAWTWEPSHMLANHGVLHTFLVHCLIALCLYTKGEKSYLCVVLHSLRWFMLIIFSQAMLRSQVGSRQPSIVVLFKLKNFFIEGGK